MKFLLDTNILVHLVRQTPKFHTILEDLQIFNANNQVFISIISIGEIKAFSKLNNWGLSKTQYLNRILDNLAVIPILENKPKDITDTYAQIDAYSQGKGSMSLPKDISARNMGKNDIWIAATTAILHTTLLTTDNDFDHLANVFFPVEKMRV